LLDRIFFPSLFLRRFGLQPTHLLHSATRPFHTLFFFLTRCKTPAPVRPHFFISPQEYEDSPPQAESEPLCRACPLSPVSATNHGAHPPFFYSPGRLLSPFRPPPPPPPHRFAPPRAKSRPFLEHQGFFCFSLLCYLTNYSFSWSPRTPNTPDYFFS